MLGLQKQHSIEATLGRDLTDQEIDEVGKYLDDDPASRDNQYLIEVCLLAERFEEKPEPLLSATECIWLAQAVSAAEQIARRDAKLMANPEQFSDDEAQAAADVAAIATSVNNKLLAIALLSGGQS